MSIEACLSLSAMAVRTEGGRPPSTSLRDVAIPAGGVVVSSGAQAQAAACFRPVVLVAGARGMLGRAADPMDPALASPPARRIVAALAEEVLRDPTQLRHRARLEALAACDRLLEPLARLTVAGEVPSAPTLSWAALAPSAAAGLEAALSELRPLLTARHLVSLVRLFSALLEARTLGDWADVESLAVLQNAQALESDEDLVILASLFWTDAGTAWPALYLVRKERRASSLGEAVALERLARFFADLDPSRSPPGLLFATNLAFGPVKAAANAFALHNQAAVVFEVLDPERQQLARALADQLDIGPEDSARLGRLFVTGHEFGHKYDPMTLPAWTEELFADLASFVACASRVDAPPGLLFRAFLVETFLSYARSETDRASQPYFDSSNHILDRLVALGALRIGGDPGAGPQVELSDHAWARVVGDFTATFSELRQGRVPEHLRPRMSTPETRAFSTAVQSLRRSASAAA